MVRGPGRRVGSGLAASLVLSLVSCTVRAEDLTAWQEITVLTVSRLELAATHCGFHIDGKQLELLLASGDLSLAQVHGRPRSASLQAEIDAASAAYRDDRDRACERAWDMFGPDGTARGYLDP